MTTTPTPLNHSMNIALPIQTYEIWEYDGEIYGSIIDWKPWHKAVADYPIHFDLQGKVAHFILVTNDPSILRKDVVEFARRIVEGRFRRLSINLGGVIGYRKSDPRASNTGVETANPLSKASLD